MESNESITEYLTEATTYQMLKAFQKLFAIILYHCEASNVRKLWDRFFEAMSKDFKRIYEDENSIISNKLILFCINEIFHFVKVYSLSYDILIHFENFN